MDWIKVKANHLLIEYSDLTDKEFIAWLKIMALTAILEHAPTDSQILKHVHYKTLRNLQEKLNTRPTNLQDIVNKVLIDVQEVISKRANDRSRKRQQRDGLSLNDENVPLEVTVPCPTGSPCVEKRREENMTEEKRKEEVRERTKELSIVGKNKFSPPDISEVKYYFYEYGEGKDGFCSYEHEVFYDFYASKSWMIGKNRMKDWKAAARNWLRRSKTEKQKNKAGLTDEERKRVIYGME